MNQQSEASTRRYHFRLSTPPGSVPAHLYTYPLLVQEEADWPAFVERMIALQADHLTLVADAGLPDALICTCEEHLRATGVPCRTLRIPASEQTKTLETARSIALEARQAGGGTHRSCLVSLGGGVIGNLTGFAASLLLRGIRLVHLPTTLLAATDSVLSLKQGVNVYTPEGQLCKNLLGTFYQPSWVLVSLSFWETLPTEEISAGMGEVVKNLVGICPEREAEVGDLLQVGRPLSGAERQRLFAFCFAAKQQVMRQDAHEKGPALILELGHTFGHALEALTGLRHGMAVGLGLLVAAHISLAQGRFSAAELQHLMGLLKRAGLPTTLPADLDAEALLALMRIDTKRGYLPHRPGFLVMVLLEHLGQPVLTGDLPLTYVAEEQVRAAIAAVQGAKGVSHAR